MNEQQLTMLVERTGDTLAPDVRRLVAGGVARGRARRRRRAVGSALGGLAVVGAVALAGALLPSDGPDSGPDAAGPVPPSRHVAVFPPDTSAVLASLLPGARVVEDDDASYQFQVQRGDVRWHGASVSLTIDSRGVGSSSTARDRCRAFIGDACTETPGGAWAAEHGTMEVDSRTGEETTSYDAVRVYDPDGYVIEASGESGSRVDRGLLRRIALDDVWFD